MRCEVLEYMADPGQIHFLRFILEASEGIATLSTLNPKTGHIAVSVAPGCRSEVLDVLGALGREMFLVLCPSPKVPADGAPPL
jgi:hypothetical protein